MMRAATYAVPAQDASGEGGECAVFFFGADQGGDAALNIERWKGQFENGKVTAQKDVTVGTIKVTTVQIEGAYLAPAGMMMQSTGKKENYKMLGAIVPAPGGMVFFKLTGPKALSDASAAEFDAMVNSISTK